MAKQEMKVYKGQIFDLKHKSGLLPVHGYVSYEDWNDNSFNRTNYISLEFNKTHRMKIVQTFEGFYNSDSQKNPWVYLYSINEPKFSIGCFLSNLVFANPDYNQYWSKLNE